VKDFYKLYIANKIFKKNTTNYKELNRFQNFNLKYFIFILKLKLINLLDFCFNLNCSFFFSLFNKKFDTIVTKKNLGNLLKKRKKQLLL